MYCYACGEKLNDLEVFCRKCGAESLVAATANGRSGPLRQVGFFALGAAAFTLLFLVIISLLSTFFPTLGSPQLTLLIMFLMGAAAAGSTAALYSRDRVGRNTKTGAKFETFAQPAELETAERLALPSENFSRVPDSVVDRTTEKLHIPRS